MGNTVCEKCGATDFITINTPNPANVNTIDSGKKVIIITEGAETTSSESSKVTVCNKCGDVLVGN